MFCTKCGNQLLENNNYCINCGEKVERPEFNSTTQNVYSDVQNEKHIMKKFKLNAFDDQNIKQFLAMNGLDYNNYFFSIMLPGYLKYALIGSLAAFTAANYIVNFDREYVYMFQLSRLSNKAIEDCVILKVSDIQSITYKNAVFGLAYKISMNFAGSKIVSVQANKKIGMFPGQTDSINRFFELKNM